MEVIRSYSSAEIELLWFGSDSFWDHDDDEPGTRADWEGGVLKELHQRVANAAADEEFHEGEDEEDAE